MNMRICRPLICSVGQVVLVYRQSLFRQVCDGVLIASTFSRVCLGRCFEYAFRFEIDFCV